MTATVLNGGGELIGTRGLAPECIQASGLARPVKLPFELPTPIYGAMLAIWHLRPVLQRRFPLHRGRVRDFVRFLAWCVSEGRRQYAILRELPEWDAALNCPIDLPSKKKDPWAGHYTVGMFLYGVARHHYSLTSMMTHVATRIRVAKSWWRGERHPRCMPAPPDWQLRDLRQRFDSARTFVERVSLKLERTQPLSTRIAKYALHDLVGHDGRSWATTPADGAYPAAVSLPPRIRRAFFRLPRKVLRSLLWASHKFNPRPSEPQLAGVMRLFPSSERACASPEGPFGVNLYGYARGEIGIGEDVRLLAEALHKHGIPFCIVNVRPGDNVSQLDTRVDHWISDKPLYAINIFCVTGLEQLRFACEQGLDALRGRYNIGFWPWELPRWPDSCKPAYETVDEIWAISKYTAEAYAEAPCPVIPMTLSLSLPTVDTKGRSDFGLPDDTYLYLYAFDLNSTVSRKNPDGVINAFLKAYPPGSMERVGLVLKANHPNARNDDWMRVRKLAGTDPRIIIIDQTFRYATAMALYKACDCYVSLHRAEGFGRSIAEALLLELQVIATGYSGNLDFCTEASVALVRHTPRPLAPKDYFHGEGQVWVEPDLDHAAELMRTIRANPRHKRVPAKTFSPATVGKLYANRLHALAACFNFQGSNPTCR